MAHRGFLLLLILAATALPSLGAEAPLLYLDFATFDPADHADPVSSQSAPDGHYIVQFTGPVKQAWKDDLRTLGLELMSYVPDFAFIVRGTPDALTHARSLPNVRWTGRYHPEYRLSRRLSGASGQVRVRVTLFAGEDLSPARQAVAQARGSVHGEHRSERGARVDATVPASALMSLARTKGVEWIEPYVPPVLHNNVGRGLMSVPGVWSNPGLFGAGEIVGIADTGLDTGDQATLSADFAGRVVSTYNIGRKTKWSDPDGHGTHVAGSVLGSGVLSGSNPAGHSYGSSFAGVAPEAQLAFQSIMDNGGFLKLPTDLNALFIDPYNDGARIHTNSWGSAVAGAYTGYSQDLDQFTWSHKDMLILFSAGNEGIDANSNGVIDLDSMGAPGTAKNCLTVGASESNRLTGGYQFGYGAGWPSDYPAEPIKSDRMSDDPGGMASFSSRGPCDDGRYKPDVVAPGTNIVSARSHASGAGLLWGVYDANYTHSGGTSMSTPLTAGAAALVREYYRTRRSHVPSGALMKATLINGATDLYPGQYGTGSFLEIPATRPNNVEGWGLVNLAYTITPPAGYATEFVDNTSGLNTGGAAIYSYAVSSGSGPVRVTLAWTDYAGTLGAAKALINDLDLTVTAPGGAVLQGNGTTDRLNNVEGVDIANPAAGTYVVSVSGFNVPQGPQPFALVFSGKTQTLPPVAQIISPPDLTALSGLVAIKGTATAESFQQYVLEYGVGASPSSWTMIGAPVTSPVTNGTLGVWDTTPLPDGVYTLRLTVTGSAGTTSDAAPVSIMRTSIAAAKNNPDGTVVTLTGKVVSAGPAEFANRLYIQEPERTSGIRVNLGASPVQAATGDIVTVVGVLQTVDGERVVANPTVVVTATAP